MTTNKQTKTPQKRAAKQPVKRPKVYNERHIMGAVFLLAAVALCFIGALFVILSMLHVPDMQSVSSYRPLQATVILDNKGQVVKKIFKENRTVVSLAAMGKFLPQAFVAAEDGRFYQHPGLDYISVLRAAFNNLSSRKRGQGGSTITQQVARSLLLSPEKTYVRKIREAILAYRIDTLLSKDDILYIYLNQIYLGDGVYGVEAAAEKYFAKRAGQLTLAEAAILAGLPQAPSRYSPIRHYKQAKKRQMYVLNRMAAEKFITPEQARIAYAEKLKFALQRQKHTATDNGYFVQIVRKRAEKILGMPLQFSGVRIYTTLDSNRQKGGVAAVRRGVFAAFSRHRDGKRKTKVPQGALVSMDSCSGKVQALVGGVDFVTAPYNRATRARRPAGSAFKPLVYAMALENGFDLTTLVDDSPISVTGANGTIWQPKNASNHYTGAMKVIDGFAHSSNMVAIRILKKIGTDKVINLARDCGINGTMRKDLSLALGVSDVSLLELTAAYTPFVCNGRYVPPYFITRIESAGGRVLFTHKDSSRPVIGKDTAIKMKKLLRAVTRYGTAKQLRQVKGKHGGKTGTTDDNRDAWFVGFHGQNMTGVWVGHDQNKSLGKGEGGARTAVPVWLDYVQH